MTAEAAAQAEAEAAAQAAAEAEAAAQGGGEEVTEVSRVWIEDCGQDSGYWEVTYSDGSVQYIEEEE